MSGKRHPRPLYPGVKAPDTHWIGKSMGPWAGLNASKNNNFLLHAGDWTTIPRSSSLQPSHYTDYAISAPHVNDGKCKLNVTSCYTIFHCDILYTPDGIFKDIARTYKFVMDMPRTFSIVSYRLQNKVYICLYYFHRAFAFKVSQTNQMHIHWYYFT